MITVVHLITSLTRGGAENVLVRLTRAMDTTRFHNIVISMLPPCGLWDDLCENGIEVYSLGMVRGGINVSALLKLRKLLRRLKPDIVQTWLYHADFLGTIAMGRSRVPLVWNVRNSGMKLGKHRSRALMVKCLAALSGRPAAVIVNAQAGREAHEAHGYKPKRWVLIPNGYDTDYFQPDQKAADLLRERVQAPADTVLLGLIARFDKMKDHESFFVAASSVQKSLRSVKFVLAGVGVDAGNIALRAMIERHGTAENVILLGEQRNMAALYAGLDIVVLSSSYGEGFPNAIAEALAVGVPVVATDIGDIRRIVKCGGTLVSPGDPQALANAIVDMARLPPEERRMIGKQGRELIKDKFSIAAMAEAYQGLYTELLNNNLK